MSNEQISALTFTIHGNYLLCGCDNGELKIYRTDNFQLHKSYEHHQQSVTAISVSVHFFITSSLDRFIKIYDTKTLELQKKLFQLQSITTVGLSPNQVYLAHGSITGQVKVIYMKDYEAYHDFEQTHHSQIEMIQFND